MQLRQGHVALLGNRRIGAEVLAEVQKMRQAGVIKPSTSEWSFPIVPVRKKDGICIDYCQLEMRTRCRVLMT